jgi:peptidyl-Lys metalloendopeptidase
MSHKVKGTIILAGLVAMAGAAVAGRSATVGTFANPLRAAVHAETDASDAFAGNLQFRISNSANRAVKVLAYQLPDGSLEADLFDVYRDGVRVEYTGAQIKRAAPVESDYITLRAGETKLLSANLASAYDLSQPGLYTIQYKAYLQGAKTDDGRLIASKNGRMASLSSAPMTLWVDGVRAQSSAGFEQKAKPGGGGGSSVVNGISYVGCSSTQISTLGTAIAGARSYSENAKGYLNGGTVGARYTTWFGAYTSGRYNTAQSHFAAIDSAMDMSGGQIKINCGCRQSYYAYVYPNQPYQIWVCKAFWTAPTTGTDSKAGTLIHEMSHFDVVANTDDVVYGQAGAKNLASTNPTDALRNADNHEYFAENTPNQN